MNDTNWKKLVEEETSFSDDFDENLLDEIQEQFRKGSEANSLWGGGAAWEKTMGEEVRRGDSGEVEGEGVPGSGEGVSDEEHLNFDEIAQMLERDGEHREVELDPSFSGPTGKPEAKPSSSKVATSVSSKKNMVVLIACLVGLVFLGMGMLIYSLFSSDGEISYITKIRSPIPLHFFKQTHEFFFLSTINDEKIFLKLELELTFESKEAEAFLESREVELKDLIYNFLVAQNPSGSSLSQWNRIIETSLFKTIQTQMPRCNLQSLTITYLERI